MNRNKDSIKQYYDDHIIGKLHGFVNTNERIERAWLTIIENSRTPKNILEIGCGIGDICWRMSKEFPDSKVYGIDISPRSIEYAKKLFGSENVIFNQGILNENTFQIKFDLIVLMDVYEHISEIDRKELHDALRNLISIEGQIILTFPTPRHLAWLKKNKPSQIQPIDEDISIETIFNLANDINKEVFIYKEISVWNRGDYAHAVLGSRNGWIVESDRVHNMPIAHHSLKSRIKNKIFSSHKKTVDMRQLKIDLIKDKLNIDFNLE